MNRRLLKKPRGLDAIPVICTIRYDENGQPFEKIVTMCDGAWVSRAFLQPVPIEAFKRSLFADIRFAK